MRIALLALLLAAIPAYAAPVSWQALPEASRIGFTAYWQGTPVKGQFPRFSLTAKLDPVHPAGGHIEIHIATGKVTMQSADITRAIRGAAWFGVKRYPEASFTSDAITKQADGSFRLRGKLRIKGHEKTLSFLLKIEPQGKKLRLTGQLRLDRNDFEIGSGRWAGDSIVATRVDVVFSIVLARKT